MTTKTIVFDLDDTLIYEFEYLKSAFKEIAYIVDKYNTKLFNTMMKWYKMKEDVYKNVIKLYPKTKLENLKNIYRNHYPILEINSDIKLTLLNFKEKGYKIGLLSDGFSITQRHKIQALGIEDLINLTIISEEFGSEKPNENNFKIFNKFCSDEYYYVADNTQKDFITPNLLGWTTICLLDNGKNIHKQNFNLELKYLPKISIKKFTDLKLHIK